MPFPSQKAIRGINLDQDQSADSSLQLATVFHIVVVCSCVLCNCDVLEWRAQIVSLVPHWLLSTGVDEVARVHCQSTQVVCECFEFDVFLCECVEAVQPGHILLGYLASNPNFKCCNTSLVCSDVIDKVCLFVTLVDVVFDTVGLPIHCQLKHVHLLLLCVNNNHIRL